MNVEDLIEAPVQFSWKTGAQTRMLVLKPGFYWSPTAGWEAIPENGQPTAAQLFTPQRFASAGVNLDLWHVKLKLDPDDMDEASVRLYTSDAAGTSLTPIDWYWIDPNVLSPDEPQEQPVVFSNLVLHGMMSKR